MGFWEEASKAARGNPVEDIKRLRIQEEVTPCIACGGYHRERSVKVLCGCLVVADCPTLPNNVGFVVMVNEG